MRSSAPEVTEGPRADILRCISTHPGIHLRRVERETELPLGQVLHHLDRLERMGLVVSVRDAGFRRYYLSRGIGRWEKPFLAALRHEAPRRILLELLARSPANHKSLQEALGLAGSTLSFHLARLVASGVLARERSGTTSWYSITDPQLVRRELVYWRASLHDPAVDRFVRTELDRLLPLDERRLPVQSADGRDDS